MQVATRLVTFSVALLDAEANSTGELCALLDVAEPADWPPPLNDAGVRDWFRGQLRADPERARWLGSYIVSVVDGIETLVGTGGYKGPPDASGTVEIGYSVVPAYQRRGIGTAAVDELVRRAVAHPGVRGVVAETPTRFEASRGLLEKCGFRMVGRRTDTEEGELVRYEIAAGRS
ncbi:MAG: GNAT family N-acetyltransferase [Devosia sp.]|nr:GNAT family N-acetyltransferase [Devosia sp.]